MSSRDYTKHLVSNTSPINTRVGDEYYDPVTNKLYKKLAVNGTTVTDVEITTTLTSVPSVAPVSGEPVAKNGIFVNASTSTPLSTIPEGYNALSVGPFTVAGTVTIPSGSRWVIL
jgi:hypothetical protein